MEKISINLLPVEFTAEKVKQAKFYKIQAIGVGAILFMTFLASLSVALRILQSYNINQVKAQVSVEEQRIDGLKDRQASLLILKNRLTAVSKYLGIPSNQSNIYKLIDELIPQSAAISSLTVDRSGNVSITAIVTDALTLDELISSLTNKDANQDKIAQVAIESLNRGKDGIFRLNFRVKPKS